MQVYLISKLISCELKCIYIIYPENKLTIHKETEFYHPSPPRLGKFDLITQEKTHLGLFIFYSLKY